jgi:hypothetical protein
MAGTFILGSSVAFGEPLGVEASQPPAAGSQAAQEELPASTPIGRLLGLTPEQEQSLTPSARKLTKGDLKEIATGNLGDLTVEDLTSLYEVVAGTHFAGFLDDVVISCCCCCCCCYCAVA